MSYLNPHEDQDDKPPVNNTVAWVGAILLFILTAPFVAKAIFVMIMPTPEDLAEDIVKHSIVRSDEMMERSGVNRAFDDFRRNSQRRMARRAYEARTLRDGFASRQYRGQPTEKYEQPVGQAPADKY